MLLMGVSYAGCAVAECQSALALYGLGLGLGLSSVVPCEEELAVASAGGLTPK